MAEGAGSEAGVCLHRAGIFDDTEAQTPRHSRARLEITRLLVGQLSDRLRFENTTPVPQSFVQHHLIKLRHIRARREKPCAAQGRSASIGDASAVEITD